MKPYYLLPLLMLSACSTAQPKLVLQPQAPPPTNADGLRYPEVLHAYHVGRYADPNDDAILHEQHVVYRVEENPRWDFHPGPVASNLSGLPPQDPAYAPAPVNDAILAEVNSQKAATAQIMMQTRTLAAALAQFQSALQQTKTNLQETVALRASLNALKQRLDALESAQTQAQPSPLSSSASSKTTNEPEDPLTP
jgi:hypothetical protein